MAKQVETNERILPAYITDNDTGVKYELDFNRESVIFAESRGFKIGGFGDYQVSQIYDLFFYAFRMHHRNVARDKTDKLIQAWGGVPERLLSRLVQLYVQAATSNVIQTDEEAEKNTRVTLEMD